jgi:hypothetical protein
MKLLKYIVETDIKAFRKGKDACMKGLDCIPLQDKEFHDSLSSDDKERFKLMKSWIRGWHQANLNK